MIDDVVLLGYRTLDDKWIAFGSPLGTFGVTSPMRDPNPGDSVPNTSLQAPFPPSLLNGTTVTSATPRH